MDSTTNEVTLELLEGAACDCFYKGLPPNSLFAFRPEEVTFAMMHLAGNVPVGFLYAVYF